CRLNPVDRWYACRHCCGARVPGHHGSWQRVHRVEGYHSPSTLGPPSLPRVRGYTPPWLWGSAEDHAVTSGTQYRACSGSKLEDAVEIGLRFAGDFVGATVRWLDRASRRGV